MDPSSTHRKNEAHLWREPSFGDAELLQAVYRTHRFPPHAHDEFAIGFIEKGAQAFIHGRRQRLIMPEGTICVINPGQLHEGRPATEDGWEYRMIYVSTETLSSALRGMDNERGMGSIYFPHSVIDDTDTMQALRAAHFCSQSPDASLLEKTSRLTQALFQLTRRHACVDRLPNMSTGMSGAVKRAREYIDGNLTLNPSLEAIADAAGMSPFHLLREFRKALGLAPHAYLVQRRVDLARHLILKGRPLRSIAMEVGYCDQGHLSREFRRFFGVPPGSART
jgi:AraC-like DNA-binding protein